MVFYEADRMVGAPDLKISRSFLFIHHLVSLKPEFSHDHFSVSQRGRVIKIPLRVVHRFAKPHCFRKFFRIDNAKTPAHPGLHEVIVRVLMTVSADLAADELPDGHLKLLAFVSFFFTSQGGKSNENKKRSPYSKSHRAILDRKCKTD